MNRPKADLSKSKEKTSSSEAAIIFLVFALLFFAGGLFLSNQPGIGNSFGQQSQSSKTDPKTDAIIERQLKDVDLRTRIHSDKTLMENEAVFPVEAYDPTETDSDKVNPLVFEQENPEAKVIKELESRKKTSPLVTPDQRITRKLERDEWARDYEEKYKDEFVRQFLENAREKGVDVRLNDDLDVTGLRKVPVEKPIRVPQSQPSGSK